MQNNALMEK